MSDLPRLLLCVFDVVPAPTALSRRVTEYLKGLSERYQVVVLSVKTPDHTHIERYHGARLLRVPVGNGDLAARVQAFDRAVRRQMESEEYVVVHSFDPFGGYALAERRGEFGYKLVYDACSLPSVDLPFLHTEEEVNRRFIAKVRRQELFCLMNADAVITANEVTREFVTQLGVPREQVQVLPAPVDLTPYDPQVMGLPDATPMKMLHLGHQGDAQDLSTLLEAMQIALQTVDVRLAIVGPKSDRLQARLEERIAALKITGKVEFQPPVAHDDLHKVLATADVGLLTLSDVERNSRVGSPLARLAEYLAAGRPVIAADVPSARAVLPEDGVVLYRSQDVSSLADAIVSLASDPAKRVKLGAAARAAAIDRDAAKIRADLISIYVTLSGAGVRAVGDEEQANPDEPTQLGPGVVVEEDTASRKRKKKKKGDRESPSSSGTGRVKTDPNIAAADETSPEAAMTNRPAIMGTPLRDDEVQPHTTEPNARQPEPQVVMGSPLRAPPPEAQSIHDVAESPPEPEVVQGVEEHPYSSAPTLVPSADFQVAAKSEELPSVMVADSLLEEDEPPPVREGNRLTADALPAVPQDADTLPPLKRNVPRTAENLPVVPDAEALPPIKRSVPPVVGGEELPPLRRDTAENLPVVGGEELPARRDTAENLPVVGGAELPPLKRDVPSLDALPPIRRDSPRTLERLPAAPTFSSDTLPPIRCTAENVPVAPPPLSSDTLPPIRRTAENLPVAPPMLSSDTLPPIRRDSPSGSTPPGGTLPPPLKRTADLPAVPPMLTTSGDGSPRRDKPPTLSFSRPVLESSPVAPPPPDDAGEDAPFVDDDDLSPVLTPAHGAKALPPPEEPLMVDDSELSPVGNTPAKGVPVTAPRFVPPIPRTPSGIFASVPAPRSPSGIFPVAPPLPRTPSGVFPTASAPRPSSPQQPPQLPSQRPAAPPPLPRTASGVFASLSESPLTAPSAPPANIPMSSPSMAGMEAPLLPPKLPGSSPSGVLPKPPTSSPSGVSSATGLFPEPPQVPRKPEPSPAESLIEEMDDEMVQAAEVDVGPPDSAIDAWFAMLVHGYCPPASNLFARHTPPTTMPGRDS